MVTTFMTTLAHHALTKEERMCVIKNEQAPKKEKPIYDWKRIEKSQSMTGNKGRPGMRIQNTDGKKPKDYSFMIAELIPAWTANAIHFRIEKRDSLWTPRS